VTGYLDHLLADAKKDGISITVTADNKVKLRGPASALHKWQPILVQHKADILAADLDILIGQAATFYQYDADDLRLIQITAASDPAGLRLALRMDPLRPYYTQTETLPETPTEITPSSLSENSSCY
jgi:hypothetical protein